MVFEKLQYTKRYELQVEQGSVIFMPERTNPEITQPAVYQAVLFVLVIDQYGYQRELKVEVPRGDDLQDGGYVVYQHPARRHKSRIQREEAVKFINTFLQRCEKYPALLFNRTGEHKTDEGRPRHEGFVRLTEALFRGDSPLAALQQYA